jgi:hypothetical protein
LVDDDQANKTLYTEADQGPSSNVAPLGPNGTYAYKSLLSTPRVSIDNQRKALVSNNILASRQSHDFSASYMVRYKKQQDLDAILNASNVAKKKKEQVQQNNMTVVMPNNTSQLSQNTTFDERRIIAKRRDTANNIMAVPPKESST